MQEGIFRNDEARWFGSAMTVKLGDEFADAMGLEECAALMIRMGSSAGFDEAVKSGGSAELGATLMMVMVVAVGERKFCFWGVFNCASY